MSEQTADTNDELIKLAYSMVIEPQRFHIMAAMIDKTIQGVYDSDDEIAASETFFSDIEIHFQNALEMMERQGRQGSSISIGTRVIDADPQPAALIGVDGMISHTNIAGKSVCQFVAEKTVSPEIFNTGEYKKFMADLRCLANIEGEKLVGIYTLLPIEGEKPRKLVLSKSHDYRGKTIGSVTSLVASWGAHTGLLFQESLGITDAEIAITEAIVSGERLADLAKRRGRSIETVRGQAKRLLVKLDLKSQTELVCLYHGFAQISSAPADQGVTTQALVNEFGRKHVNFKRSNGLNLNYEIVGNASGTPVLFLHPLISGNGLTEEMWDLIKKANIKLIMVWRPLFAATEHDGGAPKDTAMKFAKDLVELLDSLKMKKCKVLAGNGGSNYAYALAKHAPERISGMVVFASTVPIKSAKVYKLMSVQQRIPHFLARHAPGILGLYVRSFIAKVDTGYDEEFGRTWYAESPVDLHFIKSAEIKAIVRICMDYAFVHGHKAICHDLQMVASDWQHLIEDLPMPITVICGEDDLEYSPKMVKAGMGHLSNFTIKIIPDSGNLVFYQKPDVVLSALAELPD